MIVLEYILLAGLVVCAVAAPLCKRLLRVYNGIAIFSGVRRTAAGRRLLWSI